MVKRLLFRVTEISRSTLILAAGLFVIGALTFFRLGNLIPSLALPEIEAAVSSRSVKDILENPLYTPHKVGLYLVQKMKVAVPAALRATSAFYGALSIILFYYVAKRWHTKRIALMSTALYATSSWFLHVSRVATPTVMQVMLLALLAYGLWVQKTHKFELSLALGAVVVAFCLYVPGLVWFWLALAIWRRKQITEHFKRVSWPWRIYVVIILLSALTLLAQGLIRHPELIRSWFGLPEQMPGLVEYAKNVIHVPVSLFLKAPSSPMFWLDRLAILDVFTGIMFLLGVYAYYFRWRLDRTRILVGVLVFGSLLIGLSGAVTLTLLLPFIYLVVAAGLTLMLQQWFTVFPRNPLARGLAVVTLSCTVAVACFYHLNHYFIAWPNTPETRKAFNIDEDV